MDNKGHIKTILKSFYRDRPAEGESLDVFLETYAQRLLSVMPKEEESLPNAFVMDEDELHS